VPGTGPDPSDLLLRADGVSDVSSTGSSRFDDSPFIRACRSLPVDHVPVWFMRQAGRSLPEYRAARGSGSILEAIAQPELVARLTRQPVDRYGTDAAIFFSDIVVPVAAIGFGVDVAPGTGPVVADPFAGRRDLQRLRPLEPEVDTAYVIDAVRLLVDELNVPLIGFAGGPFTVASYLIEGGPSKNFTKVKALMHGDPGLWHELMERLGDLALASLRSQLDAGASAIQVFDSWAGILTPAHYRELVLPTTQRVFAELANSHPGVPTILFGVGTGELLGSMAGAGSTVIGVDWRVPLDEARRRVGPGLAVQGNLDPALCLGSWEVAASETRQVLAAAGTRPGYVFNLGHGVLPETDPRVLEQVVELVHAEGRAGVEITL
jgi:uroporphyrinogen decarboxylase